MATSRRTSAAAAATLLLAVSTLITMPVGLAQEPEGYVLSGSPRSSYEVLELARRGAPRHLYCESLRLHQGPFSIVHHHDWRNEDQSAVACSLITFVDPGSTNSLSGLLPPSLTIDRVVIKEGVIFASEPLAAA